jgi:large subunit ribosomal protein L23
MKIEPIITEKSLTDAGNGKYTFRVQHGLTKFGIKDLVEKTFDVHVTAVRTMNQKGEIKRGNRKSKVVPGYKKAIVTLKDKEKIDLFEVKGK